MRILLAAHPQVGHTSALITVGRRLREAGADVRFALPVLPPSKLPVPEIARSAAQIPAAVERAGLRVVGLRPILRSLPYAFALPWMSGAAELGVATLLFTSGAATYARAIEAELAADRASVVVADYLFFPAWLAAERRGVPFVALYHSALPFPDRGRTAFPGAAQLSRIIDARIALARRALGLPRVPEDLLARPYAPDLNILATAPVLEGRDDDLGPRTRYVGPCFDGRVEPEAATFPWSRLRPDACKVYLSLGTVFNTRPDRFRALIRGLAAKGVQIIVSAGASHDALTELASDDVLVFRRVPQLAVLRAVDVVVSHGGNNTINEALAAGRPLLVLPVGGEQQVNARRVERLGAGIALDLGRLSREPDHVRDAFARLRAHASFGERARAIARAIEGMNGAETAARLVARIARGEAVD